MSDTNEGSNIEANGIRHSELFKTLYTIPIINDSIEKVREYKVGQYIDAGARKVSDLAKPVFGVHIEKADKIAAESVQRFSTQFPLVKEPTDKILSTLKEPAMQTITTVRQYHEQLNCTIEDKFTAPGSRFVMKVDSQLTPLVNVMEDLLQRMIPDENGTSRDIQNDQQQIVQTLRVFHIALATRDRCFEKVKKQLTSTQSYTSEQLRQLQESNQLLSRATETVYTLNQTLLGMVGNLRETVQNPELAVTLQTHLQNISALIFKDEENLPKAVQGRIIELSSALLAITDSIGTYIKLNARNFPDYLQERLKPLVTFFEDHYGGVVDEIKNDTGSPLEKSKKFLQLTTNQILPLLRDLQEAVQTYTNSLNTSFHSTTDAVKNQLSSATQIQILNVK